MQLFRSIHDALERYIPEIDDESDRQEALRYLRGLKSVLATMLNASTSSNVIQFKDRLIRRRIERSIARSHHRQIADARRVHQRTSTMTSTDQPGTEDWGEWWPEAWAQRDLDNASSEAPSGIPSDWWSAPRLPSSRPRPRKSLGYQNIAEASAVANKDS